MGWNRDGTPKFRKSIPICSCHLLGRDPEKTRISDRLEILQKRFENVEFLQLAIAMNEKWRVNQQSKLRVDNLGKIMKAGRWSEKLPTAALAGSGR
jgi:hypothetical protein